MLIPALLLAAVALCSAGGPALHHHRWSGPETIRFEFEDTDTVFSAVTKDGTVQAGEPIKVSEIRIPVSIEASSATRTLTISPAASYRSAPFDKLAATPFNRLNDLDAKVPAAFSYSYRDDTDALDHLQDTFKAIRKSEVGSFLFYKMEDVHQMQESAAKIPDGMLPGQTHRTPRHERSGLGGKFIGAPAEWIYRSTETFEGTPAGYFKVESLGHEFSLPGLKTYTNFTFSMHVALEGSKQGQLLFGEGQETATVLGQGKDGALTPQVILQRQFSIRRVEAK